MASFIKAGNATKGAIVSSDSTGILDLKTGSGDGTTAVSIDASQNASFSAALKATGASSTVGYGTGAGGAVTQVTDKSTGVTLNKASGQITMNNAALLAGAVVTFSVTNSLVQTTDAIIVNVQGGTASLANYKVWAGLQSAGAFVVALENITGGSLSEAVVLNFAVIKGVNA